MAGTFAIYAALLLARPFCAAFVLADVEVGEIESDRDFVESLTWMGSTPPARSCPTVDWTSCPAGQQYQQDLRLTHFPL